MASIRRELESDKAKPYIVINERDEVYAGMRGGQFVWTTDITEGKTFFQESKIKGLSKFEPNSKLQKLVI